MIHLNGFSKSKKSLQALRNTKNNKLYILGVRWIKRLAFVRHVNRRARAIARLLLTGLTEREKIRKKKESLRTVIAELRKTPTDFRRFLSMQADLTNCK